MSRAIVVLVSLAMLGGAGYASWYGLGTVSRDAGAGSIRAGSAIIGGVGRSRVK